MDYKIYCEDCINGVKRRFNAECADLIICDPPFGINESEFDRHYNRKEDPFVLDGYVEAPSDYYEFTYAWMRQAKWLLKWDGSFYVISGWTNLKDVLVAGDALDLYLRNHIIWHFNFGVYTKNKFVTSHYHILYYLKDKSAKPTFNQHCRYGAGDKDEFGKALDYKDREDVWKINKEYYQGKIKNKNKLPNDLIEKIILYSSNEGDVVCDFFQGNFTTAICAASLGRIPIGFELNSRAYEYGMNELSTVVFGNGLNKYKTIFSNVPKNQGKKITVKERESIQNRYRDLLSQRMSKKDIVEILCEEYERGRFSIMNIIGSGS